MSRPDPTGLHYLGVAPVSFDGAGRPTVDHTALRFAPEFGRAGSSMGAFDIVQQAFPFQGLDEDAYPFRGIDEERLDRAAFPNNFGAWAADTDDATDGDDNGLALFSGGNAWQADTDAQTDAAAAWFGRRRGGVCPRWKRRYYDARDLASDWKKKARRRHAEIQTLRRSVKVAKDKLVVIRKQRESGVKRAAHLRRKYKSLRRKYDKLAAQGKARSKRAQKTVADLRGSSRTSRR